MNAWVLPGIVCGIFIGFDASGAGWQVGQSPVSSQLNAIASGKRQIVAVGADSTIIVSADGVIWRRVEVPDPGLTFNAIAYGEGGFGIAGEGADFYSYDEGTNWTRLTGGFQDKTIYGLAHGPYRVVGVGIVNSNQQPAVFAGSSGWWWPELKARTPRILRAVTYGQNEFLAVGDGGLIMSSPSGDVYTWTQQVSGTSANLRSVAWTGSRFIAAGDNGIVLTSPEGTAWTAVAPASFTVKAMASSRAEVVAVGFLGSAGRLHESDDGTTWPGNSAEYASPLNAIARHASGKYVAVGNGGLIVESAVTINSWIKPASGDWQEDFWSLGHLPSMEDTAVALTNSGWKAVAIQSSTTANYANSLRVRSLTIDAPTDSKSLLLLNYAGLSTAFNPVNELVIGPNGSLLSYYSAIEGGTLSVAGGGGATFAELAQSRFVNVYVTNGAELVISNGWFAASQAIVSGSNATIMRQFDGTNRVDALRLNSGARYFLAGGTLAATRIDIWTGSPFTGYEPTPFLAQSGGRVEASQLYLENGAVYELTGGTLAASGITLGAGVRLELKGGLLISNPSVTVHGGTLLLVNDGDYQFGHLYPNDGRIDFGTGRKTARFTGIGYPPPALDGTVTIKNWTGPASSPARDRLYIGYDSQTSEFDFRVIYFVDPGGYPPGQYFAKAMPDGEIVPREPGRISFVRSGTQMILSWSEGSELWAATNVAGPYGPVYGASSPYPVFFTNAHRFFKASLIR